MEKNSTVRDLGEWLAEQARDGIKLTTMVVRWEKDHYESYQVQFRLYLDKHQIKQMILKAAGNRSQRSIDGAVEVGLIGGI